MQQIWSNLNFRVALIIAGLMVVWLASGLLVQSDDGEASDATASDSEDQPATRVQARHIIAEPYPLTISVKGKTEANRFVDVKADVTGQVEDLPVAKGSVVKRGEVLCRLAVEDRQLRLQEAQAVADQAQLEYDGALRLKSGGFQSQTAIANAKARLEAAKATLLDRQLELKKTVIRAPFDGVVDARPVEIGDLMRPGDVCATVLDLDPLVVSGQLAEEEVVRVADGSQVTAKLITGEVLEGQVRYVSRRSDSATRTFRLEAAIPNSDMAMHSGITAEINVQTGMVSAHLISSSLLMLDDEGRIGVRYIDSDDRVRFANINLVGDDANGVWVQGLPEDVLLITVGQEYVATGEKVSAVTEDTLDISADLP